MPKPATKYSDEEIDEFLEYLDDLRSSGETNMYGARPYLQEEFGLSVEDSTIILKYWMDTFGKEDR